MKDFYCGCENELFGGHDNCTWIVLLVAAYFFLSNGCIGNIFGECHNSIIWIVILFAFLYMHNGNCSSLFC